MFHEFYSTVWEFRTGSSFRSQTVKFITGPNKKICISFLILFDITCIQDPYRVGSSASLNSPTPM